MSEKKVEVVVTNKQSAEVVVTPRTDATASMKGMQGPAGADG